MIITSAKSDTKSKIDMLTDGAADYITKPFDTGELLARIAARLRERNAGMLADTISCGTLTLNAVSHSVSADGNPVNLTRTEYAILKLLMQNPGQVHRKISFARQDIGGHARLHRELAENAHKPPAREAA